MFLFLFVVLVVIGAIAGGLVFGFFLGKQASLWCPGCGQSSRLSDDSGRL